VQLERNVTYAGPLSGHKVGVYDMPGGRVLVTDSPRLIEPKAGSWETLKALLVGLLTDEHFDQTPYLFGWLKVALESLRAGQRRTGQALAIAGPSGCGKSLLQQLITELLGGRMAKPFDFMVGATPFNAHAFTAEHLVIEDEAASSDIRTRRTFGAYLKGIAANTCQSCHAKNRQPVTLTPFWRLSIPLNDEAENLMVLPPLDESLEDKIILLRARWEAMPMPTGTDEERAAFWQVLVERTARFCRLPALVGNSGRLAQPALRRAAFPSP
jgi:mono/diheme cytochrome c family protein